MHYSWLMMGSLQHQPIPNLIAKSARDLGDGVLAEEREAVVFLGGGEEFGVWCCGYGEECREGTDEVGDAERLCECLFLLQNCPVLVQCLALGFLADAIYMPCLTRDLS
jgi:hypothetical protein